MVRYIVDLSFALIIRIIRLDLLSSNTTDTTAAVAHARTLYASCINEAQIEHEGVAAVMDIVNNEFGGWPILHGTAWNDTTFNLTQLLLQLRKYDDAIIFSVTTATNQENSSVYDIEVRDLYTGFSTHDRNICL